MLSRVVKTTISVGRRVAHRPLVTENMNYNNNNIIPAERRPGQQGSGTLEEGSTHREASTPDLAEKSKQCKDKNIIYNDIYSRIELPKPKPQIRRMDAYAPLLHQQAASRARGQLLAEYDTKIIIDELAKAIREPLPVYTTERTGGPDHRPVFRATLRVFDNIWEGEALSKIAAERVAALKAIDWKVRDLTAPDNDYYVVEDPISSWMAAFIAANGGVYTLDTTDIWTLTIPLPTRQYVAWSSGLTDADAQQFWVVSQALAEFYISMGYAHPPAGQKKVQLQTSSQKQSEWNKDLQVNTGSVLPFYPTVPCGYATLSTTSPVAHTMFNIGYAMRMVNVPANGKSNIRVKLLIKWTPNSANGTADLYVLYTNKGALTYNVAPGSYDLPAALSVSGEDDQNWFPRMIGNPNISHSYPGQVFFQGSKTNFNGEKDYVPVIYIKNFVGGSTEQTAFDLVNAIENVGQDGAVITFFTVLYNTGQIDLNVAVEIALQPVVDAAQIPAQKVSDTGGGFSGDVNIASVGGTSVTSTIPVSFGGAQPVNATIVGTPAVDLTHIGGTPLPVMSGPGPSGELTTQSVLPIATAAVGSIIAPEGMLPLALTAVAGEGVPDTRALITNNSTPVTIVGPVTTVSGVDYVNTRSEGGGGGGGGVVTIDVAGTAANGPLWISEIRPDGSSSQYRVPLDHRKYSIVEGKSKEGSFNPYGNGMIDVDGFGMGKLLHSTMQNWSTGARTWALARFMRREYPKPRNDLPIAEHVGMDKELSNFMSSGKDSKHTKSGHKKAKQDVTVHENPQAKEGRVIDRIVSKLKTSTDIWLWARDKDNWDPIFRQKVIDSAIARLSGLTGGEWEESLAMEKSSHDCFLAAVLDDDRSKSFWCGDEDAIRPELTSLVECVFPVTDRAVFSLDPSDEGCVYGVHPVTKNLLVPYSVDDLVNCIKQAKFFFIYKTAVIEFDGSEVIKEGSFNPYGNGQFIIFLSCCDGVLAARKRAHNRAMHALNGNMEKPVVEVTVANNVPEMPYTDEARKAAPDLDIRSETAVLMPGILDWRGTLSRLSGQTFAPSQNISLSTQYKMGIGQITANNANSVVTAPFTGQFGTFTRKFPWAGGATAQQTGDIPLKRCVSTLFLRPTSELQLTRWGKQVSASIGDQKGLRNNAQGSLNWLSSDLKDEMNVTVGLLGDCMILPFLRLLKLEHALSFAGADLQLPFDNQAMVCANGTSPDGNAAALVFNDNALPRGLGCGGGGIGAPGIYSPYKVTPAGGQTQSILYKHLSLATVPREAFVVWVPPSVCTSSDAAGASRSIMAFIAMVMSQPGIYTVRKQVRDSLGANEEDVPFIPHTEMFDTGGDTAVHFIFPVRPNSQAPTNAPQALAFEAYPLFTGPVASAAYPANTLLLNNYIGNPLFGYNWESLYYTWAANMRQTDFTSMINLVVGATQRWDDLRIARDILASLTTFRCAWTATSNPAPDYQSDATWKRQDVNGYETNLLVGNLPQSTPNVSHQVPNLSYQWLNWVMLGLATPMPVGKPFADLELSWSTSNYSQLGYLLSGMQQAASWQMYWSKAGWPISLLDAVRLKTLPYVSLAVMQTWAGTDNPNGTASAGYLINNAHKMLFGYTLTEVHEVSAFAVLAPPVAATGYAPIMSIPAVGAAVELVVSPPCIISELEILCLTTKVPKMALFPKPPYMKEYGPRGMPLLNVKGVAGNIGLPCLNNLLYPYLDADATEDWGDTGIFLLHRIALQLDQIVPIDYSGVAIPWYPGNTGPIPAFVVGTARMPAASRPAVSIRRFACYVPVIQPDGKRVFITVNNDNVRQNIMWGLNGSMPLNLDTIVWADTPIAPAVATFGGGTKGRIRRRKDALPISPGVTLGLAEEMNTIRMATSEKVGVDFPA